jgi:hypothetical protein
VAILILHDLSGEVILLMLSLIAHISLKMRIPGTDEPR